MQKLLSLIFILFFVGVFSYFEGGTFFEYSETQQKQEQGQKYIQESLDKFSLEKISDIDDTDFYYTPYKGLLDKIVAKLDGAQDKIYLEVYMLTETRIKASLIKAHMRGVDVRVVLEHSPYKATTINKKHFSELEDAGLDIVWSEPDNYSLNHSKIIIIDNELLLSTGNFTYSTFAHNRDLFIITSDQKIVVDIEQIFLADFEGEKSTTYNHSILISPEYSRSKLDVLVDGAQRSIKIYAQYLKDSDLLEKLNNAGGKGVNVEVVLAKTGFEEYSSDSALQKESGNISIVEINNSAKMHSKAMLIDDKYLFIGSINFSSYSMDENREMGLVFTNSDIIEKFLTIYEKDFGN